MNANCEKFINQHVPHDVLRNKFLIINRESNKIRAVI